MANENLARFTRAAGVALAAAGLLTFLINAGLTPLLPQEAPFPETAASRVFLWRQGLSALAAVLLVFGAIGLHLKQERRSSPFGLLTFAAASIGGMLVLATEWAQMFLVRDLAIEAPEALAALEAAPGLGRDTLGSLIALGLFTLGWLGLAVTTLRSGTFSRPGPILVVAGFFVIPVLGALMPGVSGIVVGNAVLGAGWFLLGRELASTRTG